MTIRSKLILLSIIFALILGITFSVTLISTYHIRSRITEVDRAIRHINIASQINEEIFDQLEASFNFLLHGRDYDRKLATAAGNSVEILLDAWGDDEKQSRHFSHEINNLEIKKEYKQIIEDLEKCFQLKNEKKETESIRYYSSSVENKFEDFIFERLARVDSDEQEGIIQTYDKLLFNAGVLPWLEEKAIKYVNRSKASIKYYTLTDQIATAFNKLHKDGFDFILNGSSEELEDFETDNKNIIINWKKLEEIIARQTSLGIENEAKDLNDVKHIQKSYFQLIDFFARAFELKKNNNAHSALSFLKNVIEPHLHSQIIPSVEKLRNDGLEEIKASHEQIKEIIFNSIWLISLAVPLLLFITSYTILKLTRGIMTSLSNLKEGIGEIGEGNLHFEVSVIEENELGELAKLLNKMSEQLRSTTVSKNLLLQEVEERKKTEEKLRAAKEELEASNEELAILNEEMEASNEEMIHEIDERQKLEEYLIEAKERAETATKAKSQFLANMSHDLRTPLNAIIGFSEVLSMGAVGELAGRQKDCVMDILESGQHLLSLINQILDLSRIEAGKFQLNYSDIEVHDLIESTLIFIKEKASNKHIELLTEFSHENLIIETDRLRLKQVLINLLGNAVKFTPHKGSIIVKTETCYNVEKITFSIEDTGTGIKKEDIHKVFNAFEQVDSSYAKEYEGSGLGLALSRRIVELMGGEIWVESEFGKGSRFSFYIPCKQVKEKNAESPENLYKMNE